MRILPVAVLISMSSLPSGAVASEADFLKSLAGDWTGNGTVLMKIGGTKVNVSCNLRSDASTSTLSMNGRCRGLVVVTKNFAANVEATGRTYSGTYLGPSGQPSRLAGSRAGNALNLNVTWARVVNGDRNASMKIERLGTKGLRLQTVDRDPASGRTVVTSRIDFTRR